MINVLPLTHASVSLRSIVLKGQLNYISLIVLLIYALVFYFFGVIMSYKEMI